MTQTYATTFTVDGSSATSDTSVQLDCSDGSSCYSSYSCTMTR
jgi:hypothetical protein